MIPGAEGWVLEVAATAGRALTYAGVLLAAGGVAFLLFAHDRRSTDAPALTRAVVAAALVGVAGSIMGVPLQAAHLTGTPSSLADPAVLSAVLESNFGVSTLVRLTGLALLLAGAARLWSPWANAASLAGALVALGSFVLAGHTAVTEPRWLVVVANYVHTTTGATWFGGLVLLAMALRRRRLDEDDSGSGRMVARFSMMATVSVLGVVLAGSALAWAEVRSLAALTATAYGWVLLAKLTLVALVVAAGAYNNRRLVPVIERGGDHVWAKLGRTVRFEAVGIVGVLIATAVLVSLVPARNYVPAEPVAEYADLGQGYQVHLVVEPARAGDNEFHVYLLDESGGVAAIAEEVTLHMDAPGPHGAPVERAPQPAGPGHFFHAGPELSEPGTWTVEVRVPVSDGETLTAAVDVPVSDRHGGAPDDETGHDDAHDAGPD